VHRSYIVLLGHRIDITDGDMLVVDKKTKALDPFNTKASFPANISIHENAELASSENATIFEQPEKIYYKQDNYESHANDTDPPPQIPATTAVESVSIVGLPNNPLPFDPSTLDISPTWDLWPGAIVPFFYEPGLSLCSKSAFEAAVSQIEKSTCLRFNPAPEGTRNSLKVSSSGEAKLENNEKFFL
jgi:hypothetical protein